MAVMIHVLTTRRHAYTIGDFLAGPGAPLAGQVRSVPYDEALRAPQVPLAGDVWIFADYDRLGSDDTLLASQLWRRLSEGGCRLLNHPSRSLRRYELLRTLHEEGENLFDVYRVVDLREPARYPVFLRRLDSHVGPASKLLPDRPALRRAIEGAREAGWPMDALAIVEFCETKDASGLYRKFGVMRIGDAVFPLQALTDRQWIVKHASDCIWDEATIGYERHYFERFPHREMVMRVFERARIQYGRVDFAVKDGRMQVWEINTNPTIYGNAAKLAVRAECAARAMTDVAKGLAALAGPPAA
ncbi:MAG: hypothetical protein IT561_17180 [Alphaproteobacteria bacterium]|nr:hypothetical protein [Alphaproteobacteria bacterium]